MTKTQTAAASLVAAIPAGILAALLVMAFLNHAESLKLMMQIVVGATLLTTIAVTVTPLAVLIFGGGKAKRAVATKKAGANSAVTENMADDDVVATSDEIAVADEDTETVIYQTNDDEDTADLISEDFADTDLIEDEGEDLILSDDDVDAFDEDEPPAKKKKRK